MTRAPRVLVSGVCLGQPAGGVRRHNAELLPRVAALLRAEGGDLSVMEGATPIGWDLPGDIERLRTEVPYQPAARRGLAEGRALRRCLAEAGAAGRPFDLVHTAHLPAPASLPVPFTLTVHDLRSLDLARTSLPRRLLGRPVLRAAVTRAARVGCVSEAMRSRLEAEFPPARERIDLIGNGEDHLPERPREPATPPFMLHVGHVEPRKNLALLLEAMTRFPTLPRLVLAGAGKGEELRRLLSAAERAGISDRVEARGPVSDDELSRLYAGAACAVFPSVLEGFGIGPAEARRAGCPVAASDIPAHLEVSGDAACYFAAGDAGGLARAVMECVALAADGAAAPRAPAHRWDDCAARWHRSLLAASGLG